MTVNCAGFNCWFTDSKKSNGDIECRAGEETARQVRINCNQAMNTKEKKKNNGSKVDRS